MPYQRSYKIGQWSIYLRIVTLAFKELNVNQFKYLKNWTSSQWSSIKFRCGRQKNWRMKICLHNLYSILFEYCFLCPEELPIFISQSLIYRGKKHLWKSGKYNSQSSNGSVHHFLPRTFAYPSNPNDFYHCWNTMCHWITFLSATEVICFHVGMEMLWG